MLDTTYALPKHTFPPQEEAIAMMVEVSRSLTRGAWLEWRDIHFRCEVVASQQKAACLLVIVAKAAGWSLG